MSKQPDDKWIKTGNIFPEPYNDVLVAFIDPDCGEMMVDLGFFTRLNKTWRLTGAHNIYIDAKYWQPLPAPPKE